MLILIILLIGAWYVGRNGITLKNFTEKRKD